MSNFSDQITVWTNLGHRMWMR